MSLMIYHVQIFVDAAEEGWARRLSLLYARRREDGGGSKVVSATWKRRVLRTLVCLWVDLSCVLCLLCVSMTY